jgi:hypothetical protein
MTFPRCPEEGELVDLMAVDQEIEALRTGVRVSDDPLLRLLIDLRDDVDSRTAALVGERGFDESAAMLDHAGPAPEAWIPAPAAPRRWRHQRLVVVPIAGALVVGSTGAAAALSRSPNAPLYPLHQLIFGSAPSSDGQITRDLSAAQQLLDLAATQPLQRRAGSLGQARILLFTARTLLPMASSDSVRTRLSHGIDAALARATALATPPAPLPLPSPSAGTTEPEPAEPSAAEPSEAEPAAAEPTGSESDPKGAASAPTQAEVAGPLSPLELPIELEAPQPVRVVPAIETDQGSGYSSPAGAPRSARPEGPDN